MAAQNQITRRGFIAGTIGMCCSLACCTAEPPALPRPKVRLAPLARIAPGTTPFQIERLAILRDDRGLAAVSMVCTHQTCLLQLQSGGGAFHCPCHGSNFDAQGAVLNGPAEKALPWYRVSLDERGDVWVEPAVTVAPDWRLAIAG